MDAVVHFEMPYIERTRMATFYERTFGWKTEFMGEAMGNYVVATTTETNAHGPLKPGAINGGFFAQPTDCPSQPASVVIAVDDLDAAIKKLVAAGGKVLCESMSIPGVGQYVAFNDTEGNRVGLLRPLPRDATAV